MENRLMLAIFSLSTMANYCLQTYLYYKSLGLNRHVAKKHFFLIIPGLTILSTAVMILSNFVIFPILPIILLYPVLVMGGKLKERFFFGIVSCIILLFTNVIGISIFSTSLLWNINEAGPRVFLGIDMVVVFIYWVLTMLVLHFNSNGRKYLPPRYWHRILLVTSILFTLVTFVFTLRIWFNEQLSSYLTLVFTIGLFLVFMLLYFIFYFVCKYFSLANEANLLASQNKMIEKFLQQKQTSDNQIKILSHDLKHSLIEWKSLAIEKNDSTALRSIEEYERQLALAVLVDVGNESANAIINQKALEARQANIIFAIDGFIYDDLIISGLDLCALLGNLLDNALEAASKTESDELRRIKLSMKRRDGLLIFIVENGYATEPVTRNDTFLTTKKDKSLHGIGMMSIKHIVDKYYGTVTYAYANHWFKAAIMLSGYQAVLSDRS